MSSQERVKAAYRRDAEVDRPEAWITLRPVEDALADAAEIDARVDAGEDLPLAGTVFAVKDNIDVAGLPTTAACPGFSHVPDRTATCVQRALDAGAVVLGKTNMDQFATGLVGTRSPYGAVRNALHPELISGGSSSGSAVLVALGVVDFALGTDTAGSGRVPAALNAIVGVKATLGLVPVDGVVPACYSYDCVTAFAPTLELATDVMRVLTGPSEADSGSRTWPGDVRLAAPPAPRVAVPRVEDLAPLSPQARERFAAVMRVLSDQDVRLGTISLTPFLDAAKLLYDGSLVAERYAAFGADIERHAASADPTVLQICLGGKGFNAADLVADQWKVREYRAVTARLLDGFDALLLPTAPGHPSIADVTADPITVNSRLGTYTNFVNLLDMAAVAVPAGEADGGRFGVSVVVRAFDDQVAIDIAGLVTGERPARPYPAGGIPLAVFGAHLTGQPLNHQLIEQGARLLGPVSTSSAYRMYALPGRVPKPAVVRVADGTGVRLAGELWALPPAGLGSFLSQLPAPMTLGKVELSDGRWVDGFGCAAVAGPDISEHGGWLAYQAAGQ